MLDFFQNGLKDHLPQVAPTATLRQAAELLSANEIVPSSKFSGYAVHSIVQELLQFLLFKASDLSSQLAEVFASKVVLLLGAFDTANLARVSAQPTTLSTVVLLPTPREVAATMADPPNANTAADSARSLQFLSVEEVGALWSTVA